jgi:INO80 complex subunit C
MPTAGDANGCRIRLKVTVNDNGLQNSYSTDLESAQPVRKAAADVATAASQRRYNTILAEQYFEHSRRVSTESRKTSARVKIAGKSDSGGGAQKSVKGKGRGRGRGRRGGWRKSAFDDSIFKDGSAWCAFNTLKGKNVNWKTKADGTPRYNKKSKQNAGANESRLNYMVSLENYHLHPVSAVTYTNIECGPSLRPASHFCDLSGYPAKYSDPRTKLRYYSAAEFNNVRMLSEQAVQEYLAVRGIVTRM